MHVAVKEILLAVLGVGGLVDGLCPVRVSFERNLLKTTHVRVAVRLVGGSEVRLRRGAEREIRPGIEDRGTAWGTGPSPFSTTRVIPLLISV